MTHPEYSAADRELQDPRFANDTSPAIAQCRTCEFLEAMPTCCANLWCAMHYVHTGHPTEWVKA